MREAEHLTVENLRTIYGEEGNWLACRIEGALPAISLTSMPAVIKSRHSFIPTVAHVS